MSKIILPIKHSYVAHWGQWEALREIVQNAKDEEEQHGNTMSVTYERGWLRVLNVGADMDRNALLLGQTSKAGRDDLRGTFGEGLDLALLAGTRAGWEMKVLTKTEQWVPSLEKVHRFQDEVCLVVRTSALRNENPGVEVRVRMDEETWTTLSQRFTFIKRIPDDEKIETEHGSLLLGAGERGSVYSKGIFVAIVPDLKCGYDLNYLQLDRDRRMVDVWELQWQIKSLFEQALLVKPDVAAPLAYELLMLGATDVKQLKHAAAETALEHVFKLFEAEHGLAVPVSSIGECQIAEHYGLKGVVVAALMRELLEKKYGSLHDRLAKLKSQPIRRYSWADLTDEEKAVLSWAAEVVNAAVTKTGVRQGMAPLLERLQVVDFTDASLEGTCDGDGKLMLARRMLSTRRDALVVLMHEEAHAASQAADGSAGHVRMIEKLWCEAMFSGLV